MHEPTFTSAKRLTEKKGAACRPRPAKPSRTKESGGQGHRLKWRQSVNKTEFRRRSNRCREHTLQGAQGKAERGLGARGACSGEHSVVGNTGCLPCTQELPGRRTLQPLLRKLSTGITNSPTPRGPNSQLVIWSKSHHHTFHTLHVLLHHEVLCAGGHGQDVPGPEELEKASAKTPSCPQISLSHNSNSPHELLHTDSRDPEAVWPQRGAWLLGLLPSKAGTCLGSSLPSHTACSQGIESKARRAAVRRIAFILLRGGHTTRRARMYRLQPGNSLYL